MPKRNITKASRRHLFILVTCAFFVVAGISLAAAYYPHQLNPDATSYFSIAQKYAHGDFKSAINGYWSPLLSWLLVPFVWIDTNLIVAAKVINVVIGAAILCSVYYALHTAGAKRVIAYAISLAIVPILLQWSVIEPITPDMLFALLTFLFAMVLLRFMQQPSRMHGILLGAIGAGMYFSKATGIYLFVGVIVILAIWQWRQHKITPKALLWRFAPVLMTLAIVTLPFIGLISLKYRYPTINTGAGYNLSVVGPQLQWHHPLAADAYPTPNATALSAWEDPTRLIPNMPTWSPLQSLDYFGYFWQSILLKNITTFVHSLYSYSPLIAAGILVLICGTLGRKWRREHRVFALIGALLVGGYSLLALESRYVWTLALFGIVSIGLLAQQMYAKKLLNSRQIMVAAIIIFITSLTYVGDLLAAPQADKPFYDHAVSLQQAIPKGQRILSDDFNLSLYACWNAKLICYGTLKPLAESEYDAYYNRLQSMETRYYIRYKPETLKDPRIQQFLERYFVVIDDKPLATVYKLR